MNSNWNCRYVGRVTWLCCSKAHKPRLVARMSPTVGFCMDKGHWSDSVLSSICRGPEKSEWHRWRFDRARRMGNSNFFSDGRRRTGNLKIWRWDCSQHWLYHVLTINYIPAECIIRMIRGSSLSSVDFIAAKIRWRIVIVASNDPRERSRLFCCY